MSAGTCLVPQDWHTFGHLACKMDGNQPPAAVWSLSDLGGSHRQPDVADLPPSGQATCLMRRLALCSRCVSQYMRAEGVQMPCGPCLQAQFQASKAPRLWYIAST